MVLVSLALESNLTGAGGDDLDLKCRTIVLVGIASLYMNQLLS